MTSSRAIISDEALADLQLQSAWLADRAGQDIAERYLQSFSETLAVISKQPDLGRPRHFGHEALADLRSSCMAGAFHAHLVFYQSKDGLVRVFRVMHGVRDLPRRLLEPPGAD